MKQHIYARLIAERRRLGISQQELAARAGLRREKVNRLESRGEDAGLDDVLRLLDVVGLELAVREKREAPPENRSRPDPGRGPRAEDFREGAFIDGSKASIRNWGRFPR